MLKFEIVSDIYKYNIIRKYKMKNDFKFDTYTCMSYFELQWIISILKKFSFRIVFLYKDLSLFQILNNNTKLTSAKM